VTSESLDTSIDSLVEAAFDAADSRFVVSTSGNTSVRPGDDLALTSVSGARLRKVRADSMVAVDLGTGNPRSGSSTAGTPARRSIETPMYLAVYRTRPEVRSVLHFQSAVGNALTDPEVRVVQLTNHGQITVGQIAVGQIAVGQITVGQTAVGQTAVGQIAVGQIAVGTRAAQAVSRGTLFELAGEIRLASRGAGVSTFSAGEVERLRGY